MTELETKKNEIATRYGFKGWDGLMDGIFHNRTNIFRLNRYLFNSMIEDLMEKSLPNPSVEEIRERFMKDFAKNESRYIGYEMCNEVFEWFKPFLKSDNPPQK